MIFEGRDCDVKCDSVDNNSAAPSAGNVPCSTLISFEAITEVFVYCVEEVGIR
jgi:hypothetical protein